MTSRERVARADEAKRGLLLLGFRVESTRGGERIERLPFLSRGPVEVKLRSSLTFVIGENGSGKTTLLEAIAARCAIRPGGGRSYAETDDAREPTAISAAVEVAFAGRRPKGLFLRADRFAEMMAIARQLGWPVSDSKDGRSLRGRKMALLALRGKGCVAERFRWAVW